MQRPPVPEEFALKETSPKIAGAGITGGDKLTCAYDLVEQMNYLYVRVVKAKDLPGKDVTGGCDPYVEVKLGNYKGVTRHFEKKSNPEWNHVFAFSQDRLQASFLEVVVKDKDVVIDDFIGRIQFDLSEVPKRVPPDSPLAPQWYRLEDRRGDKIKHGEIMLAVWKGTQADEAFPDAWHSDAATVSREGVTNIRGKVYLAPKLWYVRVNVIECQDLLPSEKGRIPDVVVRVALGNQALRTKVLKDRVGSNIEVMGKCVILLPTIPRRFDNKAVPARWHNLEKHIMVEGEKKELKFASKIHLRLCLEGGYHVLDESTHYSSDLRPTSKQLWKSSIGLLELGIISATGLSPMKTRDGSDMVRMRYDRLRSIAGRIQTVVGDMATQGERFQSLLNWRDPRASGLFVIFCLVIAIVLYVTPFQVVALLGGFYVLRHPRFRHKMPSLPLNFFRRLPARTDCML
ncbi:calcium-dependent lipid-binding (CaLB domain) plant phosphoribosyltransferase family protein [Actinidia rufa]|uniref:Calcium-dependent lipid-binding (CaLB domain) plant phosphoribosyltransferase family protein n=1 Tax=Actinidia rufa TaxID=165716 RepID=A0A7J0FLB3_9ERIC|nr:calcium-dependent lipid-binding (CaLB domain) plant phosphoribosyltransferase family protein [Actinidia rufa]